jgi:uncharacterized protein
MRPRKCRLVRNSPLSRFYKPRGIPMSELQVVSLKDEEWEAVLLADHQGLDQAEAAQLMGVSRPTFSRVLASARKAVARALVDGSALQIGGGDFRKVAIAPPKISENEMKIAFAVSGTDLSSPVDERFGRAPRFLIYDTGSEDFELIANIALDDGQGAGIKAAEIVIRAGAKAVVAGECGPKASEILTKAGVTIYPAKSIDVRQALGLYFGKTA